MSEQIGSRTRSLSGHCSPGACAALHGGPWGSLPSPHPRAPTREESRRAQACRPPPSWLSCPPDHPSALLPTPPSFLGSAPHPLCSQNGNQENPSCCGIDGILEAYHHSLRTVQLYGPTNFAPVVTHVAR